MTYEHARIVNIELDGAKRGIRSYGTPLSPIDRLVQALIRCPGITEISLGSVFTPSDFGLANAQYWSYAICDLLLEAQREGVIRYVRCLDPRYRSYFAVKTLVTA